MAKKFEEKTEKISLGYRVLSFFLSVISALAILSWLILSDLRGVMLIDVMIMLGPMLILYLCVPIIYAGQSPKLLRWMTQKK